MSHCIGHSGHQYQDYRIFISGRESYQNHAQYTHGCRGDGRPAQPRQPRTMEFACHVASSGEVHGHESQMNAITAISAVVLHISFDSRNWFRPKEWVDSAMKKRNYWCARPPRAMAYLASQKVFLHDSAVKSRAPEAPRRPCVSEGRLDALSRVQHRHFEGKNSTRSELSTGATEGSCSGPWNTCALRAMCVLGLEI